MVYLCIYVSFNSSDQILIGVTPCILPQGIRQKIETASCCTSDCC